MVCFFLVVHLDMRFEVGGRVAWKVALCALVRFLPSVNEDVSLQMTIPTKWLVTLWTIILFDLDVDLLVVEKATATCEWFRTHVTRILLRHLQWSSPLPSGNLFWLLCIKWTDHFPFSDKNFRPSHSYLPTFLHFQHSAFQTVIVLI